MRIKYITNVRLPTPRAQGYAIMKVCSEFAKAGAEVELLVPDRKVMDIETDPFLYYKIEKNFKIVKIKSSDFLSQTQKFGRVFYWLDVLSFFISARARIRQESKDVIYSRDYLTALFFPKNDFIALEVHDIPKSKFLFKLALKKIKIFFILNQHIKKELIGMGVPEDKIYISPSGVDIKEFDISITKEKARENIGLSESKKIVLYTGHLYKWKGADTLAEAAKFMPEILFVFVGGVRPDLEKFTDRYKKYQNIVVRPSVGRSIIPIYLKAADVLVLPNSATEKISSQYTSPIKMFEYMASKRPIVASNLPSIREVLNANNCFFAEPDNPQSFAKVINDALGNKELSAQKAEKAWSDANRYAWSKKAGDILEQIKKRLA